MPSKSKHHKIKFLLSPRRFVHRVFSCTFLLQQYVQYVQYVQYIHHLPVVHSTSNTCDDPIPSDPSQSGLTVNKTTSTTKWKWDLDVSHTCNIDKIPLSKLPYQFPPLGLVPPLYHEPIIIVDDGYQRNNIFQRKSTIEGILQFFTSTFNVTLSSSNSFSDHRRITTLGNYINETIHSETLPHHLSNQSWYLFGETFSKEWQTFLLDYKLPPCFTCNDHISSALSFGIGNKGSGVQWHVHGPGFSESLHGRKHWVLYPPSHPPSFNANFTSRHWMEYDYMSLISQKKDKQTRDDTNVNDVGAEEININRDLLPWECTVFPGEMIYFPDMWYHATLNLDTYTAFVSTFTTEHNIL